ncbi:hypothetical protein [Actinokineospora sp. HUAS TT18]|uniref:hypothetical protein n=1 Tax=Actinokineospora sp. HUAS TT18 TaxID=3447451 RepID=UPI003F51C82D
MTDADLLAELSDLLDRLDPVPTRVHRAAIAAGTFLGVAWDWLDLTPLPTLAVRGDARVWHSTAGVIERSERLTGYLAIPISHAELHSADGVVALELDEVGGFSAQVTGRFRLVLHRHGDVPLITEWLS